MTGAAYDPTRECPMGTCRSTNVEVHNVTMKCLDCAATWVLPHKAAVLIDYPDSICSECGVRRDRAVHSTPSRPSVGNLNRGHL